MYSTDANYYGQKAADKLPYALINASVRFPSGIYLSGMAYRLLDDAAAISAGSLTAGAQLPLSSRLSADLAFSHSFFPNNSPFVQFANANTASAGITLEHLFTTGLSADFAFGEQNDVFISFNNSVPVSLGSLFDNQDLISFTPALEIVAGSSHFYETYVIEKQRRDSILGIPVFNPFPVTDTETKQQLGKDFGLFSYNLRLPLSYSRSRYLFDATCQLSWLHRDLQNNINKPASFFNFSFYYQF